MAGAAVKELLLALGDGDSVVLDGQEWTSYEADGYEVANLGAGSVVRVGREEVMSVFDSMKTYEVLR